VVRGCDCAVHKRVCWLVEYLITYNLQLLPSLFLSLAYIAASCYTAVMFIERSEFVGCSRTDRNGRLKLVSALDMIQDCEIYGAGASERFIDWFDANGAAMLVVARAVGVKRVPVYRENLTVRTAPYACTQSMGYRYTEIIDSAGALCVSSHSTAAYVDLYAMHPVRLPKAIIDTVELQEPSEPNTSERKIKIIGAPLRDTVPITVRRNDVDLYDHVNNVRYIESALEFLPELDVKGLRVEYKAPAKKTDVLMTEFFASDNTYYVRMSDGAEVFTIMEFRYA